MKRTAVFAFALLSGFGIWIFSHIQASQVRPAAHDKIVGEGRSPDGGYSSADSLPDWKSERPIDAQSAFNQPVQFGLAGLETISFTQAIPCMACPPNCGLKVILKPGQSKIICAESSRNETTREVGILWEIRDGQKSDALICANAVKIEGWGVRAGIIPAPKNEIVCLDPAKDGSPELVTSFAPSSGWFDSAVIRRLREKENRCKLAIPVERVR